MRQKDGCVDWASTLKWPALSRSLANFIISIGLAMPATGSAETFERDQSPEALRRIMILTAPGAKLNSISDSGNSILENIRTGVLTDYYHKLEEEKVVLVIQTGQTCSSCQLDLTCMAEIIAEIACAMAQATGGQCSNYSFDP